MKKINSRKTNRYDGAPPAVGSFSIRPARKRDLREVVSMSKGVSEIENYPHQRMKEEDFVHFVAGGEAMMLVAASGKEVIGYVTVYRSENYFYLPYAVTKSGWRKRGVGGALLERVEALAKETGVEYILMSVYVYNTSVQSFLRERGYTPSKKLIQYSKVLTGERKQK